MGASHVLTVVVEGQQIDGFSGYHVETSLTTPADTFELRRHWDPDVWNALRRDAKVSIRIDGCLIMTGFIDKRKKQSRAGTMTFSGRDLTGRLTDESAPAIDYSGMTTENAIKQLISPWFTSITLTNARNRILLRGRGRRVAAGSEPIVLINVKSPRAGQVHPGQSRWQIIHEILSRQNLIGYGTPDGQFFVGKPNFSQHPQYLFEFGSGSTKNTVRDLTIDEDDGERFSLIMCAGAGGQSDTNYGDNISDNRGVVFDNPFNKIDGTGRDFIHPKRMFMPEKAFESYGDAQRVAQNEQFRRDFKRHMISVEAHLHGQFVGTSAATLFTTDTIARIIDRDQKPVLDDLYLIASCAYSSDRETAETTTMHMVPRGTEIIL